jgi:hypothetical protein
MSFQTKAQRYPLFLAPQIVLPAKGEKEGSSQPQVGYRKPQIKK